MNDGADDFLLIFFAQTGWEHLFPPAAQAAMETTRNLNLDEKRAQLRRFASCSGVMCCRAFRPRRKIELTLLLGQP